MIADEELVLAYLAGNASALDTLLERYQKPLWKYICKIAHSSNDALIEDILQDTLLMSIRDLKNNKFSASGPGSFKVWIYAIARHRALNTIDKLKHQPETFSVRFPNSLPEDIEAGRPEDADDEDEPNHLTNKLEMLLSDLDLMDRLIFELKRQGLSYKEILEQERFRGWTGTKLRQRFCRIMEYLRSKANEEGD